MGHRVFIPIKPCRHKGQNFLIDQGYIEKILEAASLKPEDEVIEIGPGAGALTLPLSRKVEKIVAIEWDKRLVECLKNSFSSQYDNLHDKIEIIQGDILRIDLSKIAEGFKKPPVILGNLPYYCATPLIRKLLSSPIPMQCLLIMIQKEVAERICAKPNTKAYGYLTLLVGYYAHQEYLFEVPPEAFKPKPKVWSSVIALIPREKNLLEKTEERLFLKIIASAFKHRRKTLINSLKIGTSFKVQMISEICADIGLPKTLRAENLALEDFIRLCKVLGSFIKTE